jgi:hypothetical protein
MIVRNKESQVIVSGIHCGDRLRCRNLTEVSVAKSFCGTIGEVTQKEAIWTRELQKVQKDKSFIRTKS